MISQKSFDKILINLKNSEALVLFELITNLNENDQLLSEIDESSQRVMFDLESVLESILTEPFRDNYKILLDNAKKEILNPDSADL
ncbi:hypothetical protein [Abyssalbus ytuae]|uniref:Uncharacterized protein n=1 Tax=Abyssalbus ytuae TaxID=2926907 RepID=A0A9E6ZQZ6_9FLAO|nr:hypothetical protein [Abyssalbus ytuae]UOB16288.1 hypothetical protein MQE35_11120 [Abyssalbus ytuae]